MQSLQKNGYLVSYFSCRQAAVDYLDSQFDQQTIGFGGSTTLRQIKLYQRLSTHNIVFDPDQYTPEEDFISIAQKCRNTKYYICSANALTEDGVIVNLDHTGNRISNSLFGPQKVYFIIGINKVVKNLDQAIWRVRNVAAPKNAIRLHLKTPCALAGGDKCYDCNSPDRICRGLIIHLKKMASIEMEIILIGEPLGF